MNTGVDVEAEDPDSVGKGLPTYGRREKVEEAGPVAVTAVCPKDFKARAGRVATAVVDRRKKVEEKTDA